jgi:hypothetical protein
LIPWFAFRVGQVTFFSSTLTSRRNCMLFCTTPGFFFAPLCFFLWHLFLTTVTGRLATAPVLPAVAALRSSSLAASRDFFLIGSFFAVCVPCHSLIAPYRFRRCPVHSFCTARINSTRWQARRDSNPQHPDLESDALPIRATGLQLSDTGA